MKYKIKRPIVLICSFYICGLLIGLVLAPLLNMAIYLVVIVLSITTVFFIKRANFAFIISLCTLFILLGFIRFQYSFYMVKDGLEAYEGKETTLSGKLVRAFSEQDAKASYLFAVDKSDAKVRVTIYSDDNSSLSYTCGDHIIVKGELQKPKGRRNPGGFDYSAYLKGLGIHHIMSVEGKDVTYVDSGKIGSIQDVFVHIKQSLVSGIDGFMPYPENTLLKGILFGYTADMPDTISGAYSTNGMSHILAVSGMNVAFIPLVVLLGLKFLNHKPRYIELISIAAVWTYAAIADLSPSVLRAAIMITVFLFGQMINKKADTINSLFAAGFIILLLNPLDIYNVGFILSFTATMSLLTIYKPINAFLSSFLPQILAETCAAALAPQIATLPIIAYYFNKIPILSLITNIAIIPFNGFAFVFGLLLSFLTLIFPYITSIIAYPLYILLRSINIFNIAIANIPLASINVASPSIITILSYYAAIIVLMLRGHMKRNIAVFAGIAIAFVISFTYIYNAYMPNDLEIVFLDVGQGDSIFIRTPSHKTILLDAGNRVEYERDGFDAGESIVLPYLRKNGFLHLNFMIYSHPDSDHIGGMYYVLDNCRVDATLYSVYEQRFIDAALKKGIKATEFKRGDKLKFNDGVVIEALYPEDGVQLSGNNSSLVLKLLYKDFSILLPGDIEGEAEKTLIDYADISSSVVKVPHHGSITSSTEAFVDAVKPRIAVISVGKNNFGHPSSSVIERYEKNGTIVYRTDESGAITVRTNGKTISVKTIAGRVSE